MNKQTLIWTLIVAVPVALAALVTGYFYKTGGEFPLQNSSEAVSTKTPSIDSGKGQEEETAAQPAAGEGASTQAADANAPDATAAPVKGPSFDVVGVEPTGETVVAGRSDAGAIVALTANGKVVGKSIANEAGEWTIILDEPLKPGDYDVALEVHDDQGSLVEKSEQHLAVSVPEGGKEQPLVVLNSPDGPSDILQKPDAAEQVAQAEADPATEETEVADASAGTATPAEGDGGAATATASGQPAAENTVVASAEEPVEQPVSGSSGEVAAAAAEETSSELAESTASAASEQPVPVVVATAQGGSREEPAGQDGSGTQPVTSGAAANESEPQADAPAVTVEAVESEKNKVFVAGTGEPGSSVRVYVGDDYQGEAKVNSSGKWLVEGSKNLSEGNVEVRADLISKQGDKVDARAAVTFEKQEEQQIVLTKVVATGASSGQDGQGAEVRKALPVVIIRKGDNLWRISRRLYGNGVRYTTIYQANQDQIRNPDLIYPGQVFLTPEGDLNWEKPADGNGSNG
ncbi:LysM peptidoglycan-binding domain-containing protein [Roseibium sp.]|uniref:LysM peptidoglycan-binding domain-containing protein n=1 Tax=Roseibium sp. TaxID=1936156 RepID=UPI003D0F2054